MTPAARGDEPMRFEPRPLSSEWFTDNVPCMRACRVLTEAGRYVGAIADGDDLLAYAIARSPNPFPSICARVCAAPCELACRRGLLDSPVAIRSLKRYLGERYGVESDEGDRRWRDAVRRRPVRPERVAIVGAGPAGLACAHDLALAGYRPVVLDASDRPGGMMTLGIPSYRLPREVVEAEIRAILDLGVELRTGVALGRDVGVAELRETSDAIFLACGALRTRDLGIPGVDLDGVHGAVDFLARANAGVPPEIGERIAVIGGGNVALDAARTALRVADGATARHRSGNGNGRREVRAIALEAPHEMPAHPFEIEEARTEGVEIMHRLGPKSLLGEGGRVVGLETLRVSSVFDPDGRFNPRFVDGTEATIPCDSVIVAIGQAPDLDWLRPEDGIEISPRGTIAVDPTTLATSAPGVFAGGDVVSGPRNLIDAVADGRRAAAAIHRLLGGDIAPSPRGFLRQAPRRPAGLDQRPRLPVPSVPCDLRIGAPEIEIGYDEPGARRESSRCLRCFTNVMLSPERCILCGGCVDVCPERCIRIVDVARIRGLEPTDAPARALVLQEDACVRCGLCIARCPTGALWMAEWTRATAYQDALA